MTLYTLLQATDTIQTDTTQNAIVKITETIDHLAKMPAGDLVQFLIDNAMKIGLKVLAAILIYCVGAWLIKKAKKITSKILTSRNIDPSLTTFILSLLSISLTVLLIVITVQTLGVDTSSFVALLAGSGLAIGMALSGTLQNFAGGIMILVFRPFKVGDYIEAQGYEGTVDSIQITATVIKTVDNKTIILPNGALSGGTINNYSTSLTRRCDWELNIPYGADVEKVKEIIGAVLSSHGKVINEPAEPFIALKSFGPNAIVITIRAWVKSEDYWDLFFYFNETIYKELPKNGIAFPIPKITVYKGE